MPSGTPSNRSQLLLSFVAIRRDSCEGSGRTSTANAELARQLGRSRQQGKGDTFLCGRRGHLPYQKMTAFFGLGGIGWSSIWVQNSDGGQIVESTPSRPRCYYLALKADAGSVPCSATKSLFHNVSRSTRNPHESTFCGFFIVSCRRMASVDMPP